jgi:hypothetical protein
MSPKEEQKPIKKWVSGEDFLLSEKFVPGELCKAKRLIVMWSLKYFEKNIKEQEGDAYQNFCRNHQEKKWIAKGEIFLFVEEIERDKSTYSKILYEDKIYITDNFFYLSRNIERIKKEE